MSDFSTEPSPDHTEAENTTEEKPYFTPQEARVIGVLMEKQMTVPDSYPLTLNSLVLGCNQKSNREPVMNLTEGEVGHIAKTLEERGLVRIEYGERAHRFEHKMRSTLKLSKEQAAILTALLLREPQTLNELKVRTQRSWGSDDLDEIERGVESLIETEDPKIAVHLPKGAGQREDRYAHLLCGEVKIEAKTKETKPFVAPADNTAEMMTRIEALEARVEQLEALHGSRNITPEGQDQT